MKRPGLWLMIVALALAACQPGGDNVTQIPVSEGGGTPVSATATTAPAVEATTAGEATAAPTSDGPPPQTDHAAVQPEDRREELTRLSNLMTFRLTGLNGAALGSLSDWVINSCEGYLVYMVVEPDGGLGLPAGSRVLIPYEAATINSGIVDAEAKTIALAVGPEAVSASPTVNDALPLYPLDWEEGMRAYWKGVVRVGKLSSACQAGNSTPENAIHKIAYASDLLSAQLKDGNGVLLGTVKEISVTPETGKVDFYVVERADGTGLTLVPLGKTNIPDEALADGATVELVLLAEASQLQGAPALESVEAAATTDAQNTARGYWGQ